MNEKTIDLQRIGGEAVFLVYNNNGLVEKAYFISRAPVRGFEKIVRGKNPVFVINAVMRICGICHSAHGIASAEAFEDAMGISPPVNGRLIRESIGLTNRVQSHLIHLLMIIPDIVSNNEVQKYIVENIRLIEQINKILSRLGGSPTHPPNLVIGGVSHEFSEEEINNVISEAESFLDKYLVFYKNVLVEAKSSEKIGFLTNTKYRVKMLATHPYYGDRYNIVLDKISVLNYREYRGEDVPREARGNTTMISLYGGEVVETGPRARLTLFHDFSGDTLWDIQLARLIEIELSVKRIIELLERIEYGEPFSTGVINYRAGKGVGVYEAPRGTLVHRVVLDNNGRVREYKIIVPTMFNIPNMERSVEKKPIEYSELFPRIYDPCIPCATHVIDIGG